MANESKKDFDAMLHDNKDMPKFQTITDAESIKKYGGASNIISSCHVETCVQLTREP